MPRAMSNTAVPRGGTPGMRCTPATTIVPPPSPPRPLVLLPPGNVLLPPGNPGRHGAAGHDGGPSPASRPHTDHHPGVGCAPPGGGTRWRRCRPPARVQDQVERPGWPGTRSPGSVSASGPGSRSTRSAAAGSSGSGVQMSVPRRQVLRLEIARCSRGTIRRGPAPPGEPRTADTGPDATTGRG